MFLDDTIAAVSTPIGKSGIGIVRLSGRSALSVADKIFVTANGSCPSRFPSHTIHYGWVKDIDEVLLTVMRAPKTYTREDIVEINCHSGIVVLRKILELVLKQGARLAAPGEFTKRAYINGRIDLVQAEAVLDIINSQTQDALKAALGQLQGRLSQKVAALRKNLLDISTQLELSIDFSDRDVQPPAKEELLKMMDRVSGDLKELLAGADRGAVLRQGISCVICGKPNVGKSSLLNALLKKDRAIVTPLPGTTRDAVCETIDLLGIPLKLIDTAGIIQGRDIAEKEAVKRSRKVLKEANVVLLVLDGSQEISSEDLAIAEEVGHRPAFVVLNKQDLRPKITNNEAKRILPGRKLVRVSALRGTGLDRLEKELTDFIWKGKARFSGEILVTNIRHREALKKAQQSIDCAVEAKERGLGEEIVALEVKQAQRSLAEIIGKMSSEDILGQIFSQFCIGK